jgi:hypothetical protein
MTYRKILSDIGLPTAIVVEEILGGNSKVLKCQTGASEFIAVKIYMGNKERIAQMLQRESEALIFLKKNNVGRIPKLLSVKADYGINVFEWISGENPASSLDVMKEILRMNRDLKFVYDSDSSFARAIDSIDSYLDIADQIEDRLNLLGEHANIVAVKWWINEIGARLKRHESYLNEAGNFFLPTYSLSDAGTHNLLSDKSCLTFVDFEFFGQDSFYKLIGDFILHPKNEFDLKCMDLFLNTSMVDFRFNFEVLEALLPFLSLKWATITSNRVIRQKIASKEDITVEDLMDTTAYDYLKFHDELMRNPGLGLRTTFVNYQKNMGV